MIETIIYIAVSTRTGISPDIVQAAFRVGDSATNVVTPFLYYCPFILALLDKFIPKISLKFIVKNTWYFSLIVLVTWGLFFLLWYKMGIPFGV